MTLVNQFAALIEAAEGKEDHTPTCIGVCGPQYAAYKWAKPCDCDRGARVRERIARMMEAAIRAAQQGVKVTVTLGIAGHVGAVWDFDESDKAAIAAARKSVTE